MAAEFSWGERLRQLPHAFAHPGSPANVNEFRAATLLWNVHLPLP